MKKGLTLIELVLVMAIGGILGLAMTCQFVAEQRFRSLLQDEIAVMQEADFATRHMTRFLRFAMPDTVSTVTVIENEIERTTEIGATIEGGHLGLFTYSSANLTYTYNNNTIEYTLSTTDGSVAGVIATDITGFACAWDAAKKEITIQLTAQKADKKVSLQTKVLAIGLPAGQ